MMVSKSAGKAQDFFIERSSEPKQFNYLVFFSMLCMTIVLCKSILSYRLIEINGQIFQAGQLISPLWFLICDMIAEIYGYRIAKKTIVAGFICQTIFTLCCLSINNLPFPDSWSGFAAYDSIFNGLLRVNGAALIAFVISGYINIRLISRWKILLKGRYFWVRILGASGISEFLYSFLATLLIQLGKQDLKVIFSMVMISFLIKVVYSIVLCIPIDIASFYIKKAEGIKENLFTLKKAAANHA